MRKFIHSDFELDLSTYGITDTAENPWFTGNYFSKYSYPFTLQLTDENDIAFGFLSNMNAVSAQTLFEGIYVHGDVMEKAVLEIEELEEVLSVTLRYGLDDFPNFKKKLAELQLLRLEVTDIYTHAAGIIAQAWPAVNYNFPQLHIDKIETEDSDVWFGFEKIINNYKEGAFLINDVDTEEEITYNRNIIQPLPYLLYLLKAGFEDAGYTLHGDVLDDALLKKMLVYGDVEYYINVSQDSLNFQMLAVDYDTATQVESQYRIRMDRDLAIEQPGKYRVVGTVRLRRVILGAITRFKMYYRSTLIYETSYSFSSDAVSYIDIDIDVEFETIVDGNDDYLHFYFSTGYNEVDILLAVDVNPVYLFNETGEIIPSILNPDKVELSRAVPDMEFGELVKAVLEMFKMSLDITGKQVWINFIANEMAAKPIIDLSAYEIKFPKRKFSKGNSFLLKYDNVDSEDYKYAAVFQNIDGVATAGYTTDDKTAETVIKALPLPLLYRNNVQTAHAFSTDASRPFLVVYDGLTAGINLSKDPSPLLIPQLHLAHHQAWNEARLKGQAVNWKFLAYAENLYGLSAKSRVHAYTNIHLVKSLQKTEVTPGLFDVEIETEII